MNLLCCNAAACAVALLYAFWKANHERRRLALRQRVAYMLWVLAQGGDSAGNGA
jgi:hypothetical protein